MTVNAINTVVRQFLGFSFHEVNSRLANNKIKRTAAVALASLFIIKKISEYQTRYGEGNRKQLARIFFKIRSIREFYLKKLDAKTQHFANGFLGSWEQFGEPIVKIPENGMKPSAVLELISSYARSTKEKLKDFHISGAIYGASLTYDHSDLNEIQNAKTGLNKDIFDRYENLLSTKDLRPEDLVKYLTSVLSDLYAEVTREAYFWNSLHSDDFPIGGFLDFQVTQMMGDMFGADSNKVMGIITSGGTMSILEAMLMYKKRSMDLGHINLGQGVILGSKFSHAAFNKAEQDFYLKFVDVDSTSKGRIDLSDLEKKLKEYGKKVVCIVASTPGYPMGTVDPVKDISDLACEYECPVHVDACLGSFIVNFLDEFRTEFLNHSEFPAVMSVSCDFHKYGQAPKGSSCVIGYEELLRYAVRTVPGWSGGRYATYGPEGSKSCLPSLFAFITMLTIGKNRYQEIALKVREKTKEIIDCLKGDSRIDIVGSLDSSVVAFKLGNEFPKGATLQLADEMKKRGIILNKLKNDCVHMCLTPMFLSDPNAITKFRKALGNGLANVTRLKNEGEIPLRDSSGYIEIAEMQSPKIEGSVSKFIENMVFGIIAAEDVLKKYFMLRANPYSH